MKAKRESKAMVAFRAAQLRLAKAAELRHMCLVDREVKWKELTNGERTALILRGGP